MISVAKKDVRFLIILFMISLCIRAGVYHCYISKEQRFWQVDSNTYHLVAQGITERKGISHPSGQLNFYRLPGYSIFVSIFYKIFGIDPEKMLWGQVLLGSCIPLLIYFLSRVLFPQHQLLAYASSFYSAFHLGLVLYSGFFMTETLFIFFLLFFLIFFLMRGRLHNLFYAGLFLAGASLIRPVGQYLFVISLMMLMVAHLPVRQKCKQIAIFSGAWIMPVSFWLIRNYLLLGHFFFHTLPGGHFLYLSAARVSMHIHNCSYEQARSLLSDEVQQLMHATENEYHRPLNEIEKCYAHEKIALKHFLSSPLITIKAWLTDIFRTCFSLYSAEILYLESGRQEVSYFAKGRSMWSLFERYLFPQTDKLWLKMLVYVEIFLYLVVLIGFCGGLIQVIALAIPRSDYYSWLLCLPFMMLFIVIALAGGYARMRLPIEPLLIILSFYFYRNCKNVRRVENGLSRLSGRC